jgi:hypothetical protein
MKVGDTIEYKGIEYKIINHITKNGEDYYDLISYKGEYLLRQLIRYCKYTNQPFIPKRRNQYYINSKFRFNKHNEDKKDTSLKKEVENNLNNNYKILSNLKYGDTLTIIDANVTIIAFKDLVEKGFKPLYFTHLTTHDGVDSISVYNYVMQYSKDNSHVKIIKL